MFECQEIPAEHKDLIHDVSYDYYGDRIATCSSDQYVKVWDRNKEGQWSLSSSWKAHSASVWKVTWANPEFGQVLATCSFDRTAAVWEEIVGDIPGPGKRGQRHWVRRTNLVDSRTSVTDVKFAPKQQGLQLATCSAEGIIRIYEAPDVMNLSQWTLQHEVQCKLPLSCLSWNPSLSRVHPPMIAVGSDEPNTTPGGKVFIYEYSENSRKWIKLETLSSITEPVHDISFAPNLGRLFHILGVATNNVRIVNLTPVDDEQSQVSGLTKLELQTVAQFDEHGSTVWRVCWNITGSVLCSSGDDGCVRMFRIHSKTSWKQEAVLKGDGNQVPTAMEAAQTSSQHIPQGSPVSSIAAQTARYIKLGAISQPSREPWY
ncbi:nucleoporin SEH1 [Euwallacea fornicatus]|uniref:nucleoporin SEH1 n=1 Tax=Euwallacea fornicatus TaxID=995702 RepID=UPI00338DD917